MNTPLIIERAPLLGVTPQIFNIELTEAATEYVFEIPDGVRSLLFKTRNPSQKLQFSFEAGASNTVYMTLEHAGYCQDDILTQHQLIYFQSPTPSCIIEFLVWY
jgi:hypothetical protein